MQKKIDRPYMDPPLYDLEHRTPNERITIIIELSLVRIYSELFVLLRERMKREFKPASDSFFSHTSNSRTQNTNTITSKLEYRIID